MLVSCLLVEDKVDDPMELIVEVVCSEDTLQSSLSLPPRERYKAKNSSTYFLSDNIAAQTSPKYLIMAAESNGNSLEGMFK